jgi:hypothetical protein
MNTTKITSTLAALIGLSTGVAQLAATEANWINQPANPTDAVPMSEATAPQPQAPAQPITTPGSLDLFSTDLSLPAELTPWVLASAADPGTNAQTTAGSPPADASSLAEAATNPLASLVQIQVQNTFIPSSNNASGYANTFVIQPVVPWKLGELQQIMRPTFSWVNTPDFDGPLSETSGFGDTALLNFTVLNVDSGVVGFGPSFVFPTANDNRTGAGKWQMGPAVLYLNTEGIEHVQWGALVYQNWTIASTGNNRDRKDVSTIFLQPIFVWHFKPGWYLGWQDVPITIDWKNNNKLAFPVGVKLGHIGTLGSQKVNAFVQPYYVAGDPAGGPEWAIKLGISFLFPQ